MATLKTTAITNHDAGTLNDAKDVRGRLVRIPFSIEKGTGDGNGTILELARIHSSWAVTDIRLHTDALTGATAVDVGLLDDSSVAADANVYGSAFSIAAAQTGATNESVRTRDKALLGQAAYLDAGATSDPNAYYRLAMTMTTAGTVAGTIAGYVDCIAPQ